MADDDVEDWPAYEDFNYDDFGIDFGSFDKDYKQDAIQKTASSAFGFFADHGESAATTYGVDAGYRSGIGASSYARVGECLADEDEDRRPAAPAQYKRTDANALKYIIKKLHKQQKEPNLQGETQQQEGAREEIFRSRWQKVQSEFWWSALKEINPDLRVYHGHDGSRESILLGSWEQNLDYPGIREWLVRSTGVETVAVLGTSNTSGTKPLAVSSLAELYWQTKAEFRTFKEDQDKRNSYPAVIPYYDKNMVFTVTIPNTESIRVASNKRPLPKLYTREEIFANLRKPTKQFNSQLLPAAAEAAPAVPEVVVKEDIKVDVLITSDYLKERYDWAWELDAKNVLERIEFMKPKKYRKRAKYKKVAVNPPQAKSLIYSSRRLTRKLLVKLHNCGHLKTVTPQQVLVAVKKRQRKKIRRKVAKVEDDIYIYTSGTTETPKTLETSLGVPPATQSSRTHYIMRPIRQRQSFNAGQILAPSSEATLRIVKVRRRRRGTSPSQQEVTESLGNKSAVNQPSLQPVPPPPPTSSPIQSYQPQPSSSHAPKGGVNVPPPSSSYAPTPKACIQHSQQGRLTPAQPSVRRQSNNPPDHTIQPSATGRNRHSQTYTFYDETEYSTDIQLMIGGIESADVQPNRNYSQSNYQPTRQGHYPPQTPHQQRAMTFPQERQACNGTVSALPQHNESQEQDEANFIDFDLPNLSRRRKMRKSP